MPPGDKAPKQSKLGRGELSVKAKANQNEREIADLLGGTRQPMSGALLGRKGDVETGSGIWTVDRFLFDSKESAGSTIVIDSNQLTKITREALGEAKEPGLVIKLGRIPSTTPNRWIAVPIDVFVQLLEGVRSVEIHEKES